MARNSTNRPARRPAAFSAANLALGLGTIVVLFLAAEFITAAFFPVQNVGTVIRFDPDVGWSLRPGARRHAVDHTRGTNYRVAINSLGMRDREVARAKRPGTRRLLFLGDSVTYGIGVDAEMRFTDFLARAASDDIEVLNAAVPGWGNDQELIHFEKFGLGLDPDLVVVTFFMANDVINNALDRLFLGSAPKPRFAVVGDSLVLANRVTRPRMTLRWRLWNLARRSQFLVAVKRRLSGRPAQRPDTTDATVFPRGFGRESYESYSHWWVYRTEPDPELQQAWRTTEAIMLRFAELCRERGIGLLVFAFPLMESDDHWRQWLVERADVDESELDFHGPFVRLERFCRANGIDFLYPIDEFREASTRRDLFLEKDGHPNAAGHALAARVLLDWLEKNRGLHFQVTRADAALVYADPPGRAVEH